jgi:hypothetical protein
VILDWFERLTGFAEGGYDDTRTRLEVVGRELRSRINGHNYGIGELELVSLQSLRERASLGTGLSHRLTVRNVQTETAGGQDAKKSCAATAPRFGPITTPARRKLGRVPPVTSRRLWTSGGFRRRSAGSCSGMPPGHRGNDRHSDGAPPTRPPTQRGPLRPQPWISRGEPDWLVEGDRFEPSVPSCDRPSANS